MLHDGKEVSPTGFDAVRVFNEKGTDRFAIGVDVNDGYKFKVSLGGALGTNDFVTVTPAGDGGFGTSAPAAKVHVVGNQLRVEQTGSDPAVYALGPDNPHLAARDTTNSLKVKLQALDSQGLVGTETNHDFQVRVNNVVVATFDTQKYLGLDVIPTEKLDVNHDAIRLRQPQTPATAGAVGTTGMICWSTGHVYVAVGTDTWMRAALSSW